MFKKALVFLFCICLIFTTVACNSNSGENKDNTPSEYYEFEGDPILDENGVPTLAPTSKYTDPSIYTIDTLVSMGIEEKRVSDEEIQKAADERLEAIENNPDTLVPAEGGKYIYVANGGVDRRGYGETPEKPFATIEYANLVAKAGDVVVLKRGHFWRTRVVGKEGVSYGAYGEGDKPTIYGSLSNAAKKEWVKEDKNIYKVQSGIASDIGLIVFDHGKAIGSKKIMKSWLKNDYDFYCSGGYLYVYSSKGNPAKLFKDIEFCHHEHIVKMKSNSTIQNWRSLYGGAHGISTGGVEDIVIDGCVIGYIGGCFQMEKSYVRFGNGIEVWGSCDGYTIKNCHVYQCYDAGITMQFQGETEKIVIEQNILFENNLLELNNYNIEYFLNPVPIEGSIIKDVSIKNNIIRGGGFGWGYHSRGDRDYGTNIMGGGTNVTANFVYTGNIFEHAKSMLITIRSADEKHLPTFTGNTYAQYEKTQVLERQGFPYKIKKHGQKIYTDIIGDKSAKIILYQGDK